MKPEDISDAIGMLDDHLIACAENVRKKHTIEQEIPKNVKICFWLFPSQSSDRTESAI